MVGGGIVMATHHVQMGLAVIAIATEPRRARMGWGGIAIATAAIRVLTGWVVTAIVTALRAGLTVLVDSVAINSEPI